MVDFHELSTADFGALDSAATAWNTVAQKLKALDQDWNTTVTGKVDSACWNGPAAALARAGLKRTNDQLTDAVTEATALASIFQDAATEFKAARAKLDKAVGDARAAKLTVTDTGTISWPGADAATHHDPGAYADYVKEWSDTAAVFRQAIDAAVAEATAADERIAYALNSDTSTGQDHAFNGQAIGGGPDADGKRAARLAARGGDISDPELTELNSLLAAHANDPAFATRFYQDLGPDGLIKSWNSMVGDPKHYTTANDARWAAYRELQQNLGLNLATATRQSNQPHLSDDWAAALRRAGGQQLGPAHGPQFAPYGYQVLSGILATGSYDPHFLNPIAEHVTQLDAALKNGHWPGPFPPDGARRGFNLLGDRQDGVGFQPTTAILTALGHSPEAATQFFHQPPTAYNADGTVNPGGAVKPADYLGYYAHDKYWASDTTDKQHWLDTTKAGPAALGHALEAATSGHPYDQPGPVPPPKHTDDQADLMRRVVDTFGTHGDGGVLDDLKGDGKLTPLRSSLARMSADYMGDVQRSVSDTVSLPVNGAAAGLDKAHTLGLLDALGRDPDSYGIVANAGQAYTSALVQGQIVGGGPVDWKTNEHVTHAAYAGGVVSGILGEARIDEVHNQHAASDQAYNAAVERNGGYAKEVFGKTLGLVADKVPFGDKLPGLVDSMTDAVVKANEINTTEDGRQQARGYVAEGQSNVVTGVQQAVRDAGRTANLSPADLQALLDGAGDSANRGYTSGVTVALSPLVKGSNE
ncbi:hypothetical protein [Kitasatospora sp. NPDC097643]|uniref:hypothetical protein n=1 Tax=Kitasatospora sp. NPDC097643 TaxID=3157230 RepID=UPI0033329245